MLDALIRPPLLIALVTAVAGPWFILAVLRPASRQTGLALGRLGPVEYRVTRTGLIATWIALATAVPELYLQVADISGVSPLRGVPLVAIWRLLTRTTTGWVWIARVALLAGLWPILAAGLKPDRTGAAPNPSSALRWGLALALSAGALASRALASHASALVSGSLAAKTIDAVHILAAASWIGLLIHFRLLLGRLCDLEAETRCAILAPIVNRITPIALASGGILAATGLFNAVRHLDSLRAIIASPYGLTLLSKMLLLLPILVAGSLNFLVIRPALAAARPSESGAGMGSASLAGRLLSLVEIEVGAGAVVLAVAAILSVSPPAVDDPRGTLSLPRLAELFRPRLPRLTSPVFGPGVLPSLQPTPDDFAYSEFNHHWSGAALIVLAVGSFLGGLSSRRFRWARAWPVVFVLLAAFLFARNDREMWPLGPIGFIESLRDPEVVQHRLSVVLLLALGWVEYLGRRGHVRQSRWAYIFPSLCIVGGLMLFSHTHDTLAEVTDTQTYLALQHGVMGLFGLLAGLSRWFELRGHEEGRWFGRLWPLFVFLLGVQMFIFYKEM